MEKKPFKTDWHSLSEEKLFQTLETSPKGLSKKEAEERLRKYGYNELAEKRRRTALQMLLEQFKDVFILLLIFAAVFSIGIGYYESLIDPSKGFFEYYTDALTIVIIVLMVAVTGFVQEYRAENAFEALKRLAAPKAKVIRDGIIVEIPAKEVVPGDVIALETGDSIPADARIIEAIELRANEAILTGESTPTYKQTGVFAPSTIVSDRKNMVFSATHIVYGRGKAVATGTGADSEFQKIAGMVEETKEKTPLEKKLDSFAARIAKIVIAICIMIFALEAFEVFAQGQFKVQGFIDAFMSAIALAISAVPEGLPAIVTITLALGAKELAARNAIIRKLSAAETLGAVTVICSDKTGTLTKGEMTVRQVYADKKTYEVTGAGYEPKGDIMFRGKKVNVGDEEALALLLKAGALCNNAFLVRENDKWKVTGDPTEAALIVAAEKAQLTCKTLQKECLRIGEIPFTSERKSMATLHRIDEMGKTAFMKGAPEVILEKCTYILEDEKKKKLTGVRKREILGINEEMANRALRILGIAHIEIPEETEEFNEKAVEKGLVFVGLVGMIDPPREEAIEANKKCQRAGIKTVMITGDHKSTAVAIAKEIGIFKEGDMVLTGEELVKMDEKEFEDIVEKVTVYARVLSEHKLKIVKALKAKEQVVAMTGDGVNDAPAVKTADIGIAMGITGTDVTKEASSVVLVDDNFSTIVQAVEQGRIIYDNIRKYARFLLACNFDELLVIGTFAMLGGILGKDMFPLPLLPAMILWINLITDGAPAVSLANDPPDEDVMDRPPRKPGEEIWHGMLSFITASFLLQAVGTFLVFGLEYYVWPAHGFGTEATLNEARTVAFVQSAMFELLVIWNCRSENRSLWRLGRKNFSNKFFVISEIISIALTLAICYIPVTQRMFHIVPLSLTDLAYVIGVASWGLFVVPEVFMRRKIEKSKLKGH